MFRPTQCVLLVSLLVVASLESAQAAEREDVRKAINLVTSVKMPFPENLTRNRAKTEHVWLDRDGATTGCVRLEERRWCYEHIAPLGNRAEMLRIRNEPARGVYIGAMRNLPERIAGAVEFDHVSFEYTPGVPVLRDVSFQIAAGERVAFVGATGAGKTSLVNLLLRFYDIQGGTIRLDGVDIAKARQKEVRRHIGLVLQDPFIFTGTIEENIRLRDTSIPASQVRNAARLVGADRFINELPDGYQHRLVERGANLSTGQKQLLAFARSVAFDPEVMLVLDEATANIDSETEALIQASLDRLTARRTSIIIAHRLATVRGADRIIVLHRGEIVEQGTHDDLLALRGRYYRLWLLQQREVPADAVAPVADARKTLPDGR